MALEKKITGQEDQVQNQNSNTPQALAGSSQSGESNSRLSAFSTGAAPQTQGSGRFTNIQKYMDANTTASDNLGAKANNTINKDFNKQSSQVSKENENIQSAFQKGKQTLEQGSGFNSQLGQINKGLSTGFTDFGNRDGFDNAGKQAIQLSGSQDYNKIASGQGIDEVGLDTSQKLSTQLSQDLLNRSNRSVSDIETEQGRDALFSKVLQPNQGYSSGQRSFDKLFLGGALGGIKSNLQTNRNAADLLSNSTAGQQTTLDDLTRNEAGLVLGLKNQSETNQNVFNQKFGDEKNIDYINNLRNQRFDGIKSSLQGSGSLSKENADLLGVGNLGSTFINDNRPVASGDFSSQVVNDNQLLGTYNLLNDPASVNNYITQGQNATSVQDITTQPDYDAYKALQTLALGRNTGKIGGISSLGAAVNSTGKLATDISAADKAFRNNYGNKNYQNSSAFMNVTQNGAATPLNEIGMYNGGNQVGSVGQVGNTATIDQNAQNLLSPELNKAKYFVDDFYSGYNGGSGGQSSVTGDPTYGLNLNLSAAGSGNLSESKIGDYLKSNNVNTQSQAYNFLPKDKALSESTAQQGNQIVSDRLKSRLNEIIQREGVKNSLDIVDQAPQYTRFRGLV